MQTITEIYTSDKVVVRLVRVTPGSSPLQRQDALSGISIPLSVFKRGISFESFRNHFLFFERPREYYSLNCPEDAEEEVFVQFLWTAK